MRIWDISPGYLNRQSLLGEHRELHGIAVILAEGKKGYSRHPETLRWARHVQALAVRHRQLACEMRLRGYREQSPLPALAGAPGWPNSYLDEPAEQFSLLISKYVDREQGRIPLPRTSQQLWSQHKYSVLARDVLLYKEIGRNTASGRANFAQLTKLLTELLRQPPSAGGLRNAAQHIWDHVADLAPAPTDNSSGWSCRRLLEETQCRAMLHKEPYLLASTALAELAVWLLDTP